MQARSRSTWPRACPAGQDRGRRAVLRAAVRCVPQPAAASTSRSTTPAPNPDTLTVDATPQPTYHDLVDVAKIVTPDRLGGGHPTGLQGSRATGTGVRASRGLQPGDAALHQLRGPALRARADEARSPGAEPARRDVLGDQPGQRRPRARRRSLAAAALTRAAGARRFHERRARPRVSAAPYGARSPSRRSSRSVSSTSAATSSAAPRRPAERGRLAGEEEAELGPPLRRPRPGRSAGRPRPGPGTAADRHLRARARRRAASGSRGRAGR